MTGVDFFIDRGHKPKGVIHIGAHYGQEVPHYQELGLNVLAFEPIPEAAAEFKRRHPDVWFFQLALSDVNAEADFYVTGDGAEGQCSSLFAPLPHADHMTGGVKQAIKVKARRFDDWANEQFSWFDRADYDTVIIDTQGSEFEVIAGMKRSLAFIKYLIVECSEVPLYEGGAPAWAVYDLLAYAGFEPVKNDRHVGHDDAYFMARPHHAKGGYFI